MKNCLFICAQSTSNAEGMSSLESLSKDDIPSALEVDCMQMNEHFFMQNNTSKLLKNLKLEEWLPIRV